MPCPFRFRLILLAGLLATGQLPAQDRHFPLDHRAPTGTAGRWSVLTTPTRQSAIQPLRVSLPGTGTVSFYPGSPHSPVEVASPAQVGTVVGHVYRIRISGMAEYPGVELFPTIEVLDRLHPPPGLAEEFPIPVEITEEEIELAMQDRMVTKVIYLEQPDLAQPVEQTGGILIEDLPASANLLQMADLRGRPMAILRIGGRIPDPNSPVDEFHSRSPLRLSAPSVRQ